MVIRALGRIIVFLIVNPSLKLNLRIGIEIAAMRSIEVGLELFQVIFHIVGVL